MSFFFAPDSITLDQLADAMERTPGLLKTALKRQAGRFKSRVLSRLQVQPGKVKYPIEWESEKQRRAFFATDGFGRGIGTPRTGALSKGWRVDVDFGMDYEISTYNIHDYAQYVVGDKQQRMHRNTGWMKARPIMDEENERFIDVIRDTVFTVGDPTANIR
jgi:hypothetical protein